ncbi:MAG: yhdN 1 [Sphingobacteriaceae bacterium]|jgi:aryl-alcohol dehydrogenase-like predicted oxidoreductase|nr:yhdN 1 [Sphingobacteriaceae bacterium]
MKYNFLGNTGVLVSELCLGTMTFGGEGRWQAIGEQNQQEVNEILKLSFDAGINFIDTANVYSYGKSEELLGQGIKECGLNRNELFIATKVRGRMGEGKNQVGLSRYHVLQSLEESLKRLQLDHVDLLYVHGFDFETDIEQVMHMLHDIVVSGKARYVGVCNWPAWLVMKGIAIAKARGWHTFIGMQYYYSAAGRDAEYELIPLAIDQKMAFMPWSPLAGGFLSGKFTREQANTGGESRRDKTDFPPVNKEPGFNIVDAMIEIGKEHNVSAAEIGLAWVRQQKGVTSTIIGAKTIEQLKSNIKSVETALSQDEINKINESCGLRLPYPSWMLERQAADRKL